MSGSNDFLTSPQIDSENQSLLDEKLALLRIRRIPNVPAWAIEEVRAALLSEARPVKSAAVDDSEKDIDLRLRQLIQGGAPWHVISELLWHDFQLSPSDQKAARLLETSFVQTSPIETVETFIRLMTDGSRSFYWLLHPSLRDFLLEHADASMVEALYWMIAKEKSDSRLTDIEVLFTFLRLNEAKDKMAAWMYFKRNEKRILAELSDQLRFGYSRDQLYLKIGELALQLGYDEEARELFNELPRPSKERDLALVILLKYESSTFDRSKDGFVRQLEATPNWQDRIKIIEGFCQEIRRGGGLRDPNRSSLNMIMKNLLQWVPRTNDAWRAAGELILRNRDLGNLVPALYQAFYDNACVHHAAEIDQSLWLAAIHLRPETPGEAYLSGLGWLHHFVASSNRTDNALWTARKMIEHAASTSGTAGLPWAWRELVRTALNYIERSQLVLERDRKRILSALRISVDGVNSSTEVIQTYLALSDAPTPEIIAELAEQAWQKKNYPAYVGLAARGASLTTYSNPVLDRLWHANANLGDHDLSWRVATVLATRAKLSPKIRYSWEISGERRSVYAPTPLTNIDVEFLLADFSKKSRRVLHGLFLLGRRISELVENTKGTVLNDRPSMVGSNATETSIVKAVTQIGLVSAGKHVQEMASVSELPFDIAALIQSPDSNPWLFTTRLLFERLGMSSWGYQRQTLMEFTTSVLPLIGSSASSNISAKLGKWLMSLNTHQRAAWGELAAGLAEISDPEFQRDVVQFVIRLATMIYPSHYDGLLTLQKSRTSLVTLRGLEYFILSATYSEFRRRSGIQSRVILPKVLLDAELSALDL